jgi:hypothetical protein
VFRTEISLLVEGSSLRRAIDVVSLSGTEEGLVSPMKYDLSGLSSWRLRTCLETVEELVVVGGPMSACPTSPSMIQARILWSRQVLAT